MIGHYVVDVVDHGRAGGLGGIAQRLAEPRALRAGVTVEEVADMLWVVMPGVMRQARASEAASAFGLPAAFALLLGCEAGLPVPLPADLLMLVIGERVSAGTLPLWLAILAIELVAVAGTATLLLATRGPARVVVSRLGPRVGLTSDRLQRATRLIERRGLPALLVGRATPGLRTVTGVAAGLSALRIRLALPVLVAGSSVFLQAHLLAGYAVGPYVRGLLHSPRGLVISAAIALVLLGAAIWTARRRRADRRSWTEGSCPACLAVTLLAERNRTASPR